MSDLQISPEKSYVGRKLKSNIATLLHQRFLSCPGDLFLRVTELNITFKNIVNDTSFISILNLMRQTKLYLNTNDYSPCL